MIQLLDLGTMRDLGNGYPVQLTSYGDPAAGLVISSLVDGPARVDSSVLLDHRQQTQGDVAELVRQRGAGTCRIQEQRDQNPLRKHGQGRYSQS